VRLRVSRSSCRVVSMALMVSSICIGATVSDLKDDYGPTQGPYWYFLSGFTQMNWYDTWAGGPGANGWIAGTNTSGDFVPAVVKVNTAVPGTWSVGDIGIHALDGYNGGANGDAQIAWLSDFTGLVDITLTLWTPGTEGRNGEWQLYGNPALLGSGVLYWDSGYSQANPLVMTFSNVPVGTGDNIRFWYFNNSGGGGPMAGIDLSIRQLDAAVPERDSLALVAVGLCVLLVRRR